MEIRPGLHSSSLQVALSSLPALARAWTVGQTIEALVLRVDPAAGTVLLLVPEGEVEARSEIPLQPGTQLQLTPETSDGTRILLRVGSDTTRETWLAALRQALPREQPLAPVFETVTRLLQSPPPGLPEAIRREAQALSQARPTPQRLATPQGLRSALRDAGMLLESRLADPESPPPANDLKGRLLALLLTLTTPKSPPPPTTQAAPPPTPVPPRAPLPPGQAPRNIAERATAPTEHTPPPPPTDEFLGTLARHVEGALSRIQLHQLQALPDNQPAPLWLFELPVRTPQGNETLLLRFEREPAAENGAPSAATGWRVTLDLSSPEYGALRAVVTWRGGEITTRFLAEREATTQRLRDHLQHLNQRLAAAGIRVGAMEAHTGIPAAPPRPTTPLLSEHA